MPLDRTYRETADVAKATRRLVRSIGRRIATEDPEALVLLADLEDELRTAWRLAIEGMRSSGFTDREIGDVLRTSRHAVQQRWPHA